MKISFLLSQLVDYEFAWITRTTYNTEVYAFQQLGAETAYEEGVLYITEKIPSEPYQGKKTISMLFLSEDFVEDAKNPFMQYSTNCNIIAFRNKLPENDLVSALNTLFFRETQHIHNINHLFMVSSEGRGLQHLVDEAYKITNSPIIIIDTSYKILAMAKETDLSYLDLDLEKQTETGYLTEQNISRLKQDKLYERLRELDYPLYSRHANDEYGWINTLVYLHGMEAAEIGMLESHRKFDAYDLEFIHAFRKIVASEMQNIDFYNNNSGMMHSVLLKDLLLQSITSNELIELRVKQLGWSAKAHYYVLTIFDTSPAISQNRSKIISSQIKQLLPECRWVLHDNKLVFLIPSNSNNPTYFKANEDFLFMLEQNKLRGILSDPFEQLQDIHKYHKQTLLLFDLLNHINQMKTFCVYQDYLFYHIAQALNNLDTFSIHDFYHPAIEKMRQYDEANNTNFLETLKEYLDHIDNPTLCAKNLFIHKNTFFYRRNRIKELFDLTLDNGDERLRLQFTLELMKFETKKL